MIQFNLAQFNGPKFSLQDLSFDSRATFPVGKIAPVASWEVFPNEKISVSMQQLTRFMPMPAPVMQRFDVYFDSFFVPYRLLKTADFDSESYFNYRKNSPNADAYSLPLTSDAVGIRILSDAKPGTLSDYLGIPSILPLYRSRLTKVLQKIWSDNFGNAAIPFDFPNPNVLSTTDLEVIPFDDMSGSAWGNLTYQITFEDSEGRNRVNFDVVAFRYFVLQRVVPQETYNKYLSDANPFNFVYVLTNQKYRTPTDEASFWLAVKEYSGWTLDRLQEAYLQYALSALLTAVYRTYPPVENTYRLNKLPWMVYHRIIGDWYINTNFEDPDDYYASHISGDSAGFENIYMNLAERYWGQDYFTSAFVTPQVGNAVRIPAGGTIADLRSANSLQKMLERALYAGKRYIEQIFAFFGARSSDARLDRTEVLGRKVFRMNINDVTQTNQADFDSMLASPVGQISSNGLSVAGDHLFNYNVEEHGMVMILCSIRPKAAYYQGIPRFFLKRDVEDFLWPQLANLGEQPIYSNELVFDPLSDFSPASGNVFGFNRRYAEYLYHPSEVHGEMRSSLDYWHSARQFDGVTALNTEFLKVTDADKVTRIFNVPEADDNIVSWMYFDCKIARALPRYIDYDL